MGIIDIWFWYLIILYAYSLLMISISFISEKKDAFIIAFIIIWVYILSLRDLSIGIDTITYIKIFETLDFSSYPLTIDPLFKVYIYALNFISNDGHFFLFITSLIINFIILFSFYKLEKENYYLVYLLFFVSFLNYNIHFNIIRQGLSISFVMLSIVFLMNKKYLFYTLSSLIAFSFHASSIFVFILWIIVRLQITYVFLIIYFIAVIYLFNTSFLISITQPFIEYHWAIDKLYRYLTWEYKVEGHIKHIYYLVIGFILYLSYNLNKIKEDKVFYLLYKIYLLGFLIFAFFHDDMMMADRFFYYFIFIGFILIVKSHIFFENKRLFNLVLIFSSFVWLLKTLFIQYPNWFIYKTYMEGII